MSIFEQLDILERKVNFILIAIPEWTPISSQLAQEKGYKTVDGFRKYCLSNVHPSQFKKIGKSWHIHRDAWIGMI